MGCHLYPVLCSHVVLSLFLLFCFCFLETLILGDYAAASVLITMGAVLGKTSPSQMLLLALLEPIFYSLNEQLADRLHITDMGGTMVIHAFGCFFGLAATKVISDQKVKGHANNSAVYHSDLFAMIGTLFLWMFWPSFNGALADGPSNLRAVVNTVFSLTASCMAAFVFSYILRKEKVFK